MQTFEDHVDSSVLLHSNAWTISFKLWTISFEPLGVFIQTSIQSPYQRPRGVILCKNGNGESSSRNVLARDHKISQHLILSLLGLKLLIHRFKRLKSPNSPLNEDAWWHHKRRLLLCQGWLVCFTEMFRFFMLLSIAKDKKQLIVQEKLNSIIPLKLKQMCSNLPKHFLPSPSYPMGHGSQTAALVVVLSVQLTPSKHGSSTQ